jgi:hypothetical protein
MPDEIVLDLGEYGEILVETEEHQAKGGLLPASRSGEEKRWKVNAKKILQAPLTGLGKLFMATLPEPDPEASYEIDEFSVEFELGIGAEVGGSGGGKAGVNVGAVADAEVEVAAKLTPNGTFKCTYTWKRKHMENEA